MSAIDAFEWYVSSNLSPSQPEVQEFIRTNREYLLTLRSEDERQRFVGELIDEMNRAEKNQKGG